MIRTLRAVRTRAGAPADNHPTQFRELGMASRPNVVIVGGGIGGLFAANALIAEGLQVTVHEQASTLGEIGAGVFVTPNAVRHLERVGLGPAVERWGARVGPGSHYFRHDGTPIAPVQVTDASGWNAVFGMHRADFVNLLAARLPDGVVHTGRRAVGFVEHGDVARVSFANGATAEGDIVVAADGIHSVLQSHVVPPSKPVFHGTISYRGACAEREAARLADGSLADVGRSVQAFPCLPGSPRHDGELRWLRADR
jgi:salicylate hydroxylase